MKHKVSELTGALLDAAVAKTHGFGFAFHPVDGHCMVVPRPHEYVSEPPRKCSPSTDWSVGGPIIEREHIAVYSLADAFGSLWAAGYNIDAENGEFYSADSGFGAASIVMKHHSHGNTPLIAAMRAYVASKFGEEVEL